MPRQCLGLSKRASTRTRSLDRSHPRCRAYHSWATRPFFRWATSSSGLPGKASLARPDRAPAIALVICPMQDDRHSVMDTCHHLVRRACHDREVANIGAWPDRASVPNASKCKGTVICHCDCIRLPVLSGAEYILPLEETVNRHQTPPRAIGRLEQSIRRDAFAPSVDRWRPSPLLHAGRNEHGPHDVWFADHVSDDNRVVERRRDGISGELVAQIDDITTCRKREVLQHLSPTSPL